MNDSAWWIAAIYKKNDEDKNKEDIFNQFRKILDFRKISEKSWKIYFIEEFQDNIFIKA